MQTILETVDKYAWWSALNHGGLLIAPVKLGEFFVEDLENLPFYINDRLRRDLDLFDQKKGQSFSELLDTVLERVLGLTAIYWRKGNQVDSAWSRQLMTGESLKPQRLWQEPNGGYLPVFTVNNFKRLGVGKGKRSVSRVVEWLRRANQKIALLTNGYQWRLIHAGSDYDAWCETDTSLWFEEGKPSLQVQALRILLSPHTLTPEKKGSDGLLLAAIASSRQGQADLSENLGERVRQAVELLIRATLSREGDVGVDHKSLYIAATRIIMRCVFVLFAESRDLLPRTNPIYNQSYSLQSLREQLDRVSGGRLTSEALRSRWSAYPRLLALFSLVYHGCPHEALPIPNYGGGLFKQGDRQSKDPVLRALALLEQPDDDHLPSDEVVYRILELLTRSQVKVRQGNKSTWVTAPVDFSDLSSEYIGILYEGLLDFELRQAELDNPMIFLNLGNQPVLPLSRLEEMDDKSLESLVEKLKKQAKAAPASEDGGEGDADEEEITDEDEGEDDLEEEETLEETEDDPLSDDLVAALRDRTHQWAVKAVKVGKLVTQPRSKKADAVAKYEAEVDLVAKRLINRIILPGEWFLVRWGGTRKGSGTFYTRPQLAVPTVRRTLEPLVYESPLAPLARGEQEESLSSKGNLGELLQSPPSKGDLGGFNKGNLGELLQSPSSKGDLGGLNKGDLGGLKIKSPKEILNLKICDPACGSASFPVAALRYLTEALWESLFAHGWLIEDPHRQMISVGIPKDAQPEWFVRVVEDFPLTAEKAEEISKAQLKRYVVENCIYGVDINPLAVELGRLALWVETMDRSLPFTFLDHKIKCGNALVGCWFDRFQDYPVMAWEREGGDKNHTKFVHHFREKKGKPSGDKWTQAIKDLRNDLVKPELKGLLECLDPTKPHLTFPNFDLPQLPEAIHDQALAVFEQIHSQVNNPWQQEEAYREQISESEALSRLRFAFDLWCAVWFWEGDDLGFAPTPNRFYEPPEETRAIVERLAQKYQFFHWELEFPDVFSSPASPPSKGDLGGCGFDGVIGNPPWEIQKPNSMEFFSNIDPLYRTYGKQEAISKQVEYFTANAETEREWLVYNARLKALSNWTKYAGFPFGDSEDRRGHQRQEGYKFSLSRSAKETEFLHGLWHNRRVKNKGYADPNHPFVLQGSADINTYKMFLELSLSVLKTGGRMGLIVPSGVYTDKGATALRTEFLEFNQWHWLFGFENRDKIFSIDSRFKFCPVIVEKGGKTEQIKATFMQRSLASWENAEDYVLDYPRERVEKFSPKSKAILEICSARDLEVLTKIYGNSVLLGDESPQGWGIEYATEFHMTNDSKLFPPRPKWEAKGYVADEYGHWLKGNWGDVGESGVGSREWAVDVLSRPEGVILSRDKTQFIRVEEVEDIALPLYQGIMIQQFDFAYSQYSTEIKSKGEWINNDWTSKEISSLYLMNLSDFKTKKNISERIAFRDVQNATNQRTMIACIIPDFPCGNTVPLITTNNFDSNCIVLSALTSFPLDRILRMKMSQNHVNWFYAEELPLPKLLKTYSIKHILIKIVSLANPGKWFSNKWLYLSRKYEISNINLYQLWAITPYERLRLRCILDVVVAELYGLEKEDFAWILKECDYPAEQVTDKTFSRTLDPKGFWRVDKEKDPELRHTVLSLVAFHELKKIGLEAFLNLNDGEGWMLPDTLRLADYDLGHGDRAEQPQPVASRFTLEEWDEQPEPKNAPINYRQRFYPWQLAKTPEQSWAECERHADNLKRLLGEPEQNVTGEQITMTQQNSPPKSQQLALDLGAIVKTEPKVEEDWLNLLMTFIHQPLGENVPLLSDAAISRENIYTREDEQL